MDMHREGEGSVEVGAYRLQWVAYGCDTVASSDCWELMGHGWSSIVMPPGTHGRQSHLTSQWLANAASAPLAHASHSVTLRDLAPAPAPC